MYIYIICMLHSGCLVGLVFFLYKTGEAMLDAAVRPFVIRAVCEDVTRDLILLGQQSEVMEQLVDIGAQLPVNASLGAVELCDPHLIRLLPGLESSVQAR